MKKFIKEYAKTFAAFIAGVVGNVLVNLINGTTPWPQTGAEWIQLALTSFGPAIATWFTTNKITQDQIDKDPTVERVTRPAPEWAGQVDAKPLGNAGTGEYRNPWTTT